MKKHKKLLSTSTKSRMYATFVRPTGNKFIQNLKTRKRMTVRWTNLSFRRQVAETDHASDKKTSLDAENTCWLSMKPLKKAACGSDYM